MEFYQIHFFIPWRHCQKGVGSVSRADGGARYEEHVKKKKKVCEGSALSSGAVEFGLEYE
jgi:hypothetical protein